MSDETYYKFKRLPQLESDDTGFDSPGGNLEGLGQFTALTMYKGQRERFILTTIDDILPRLAESCVFSLLDTTSGFWQIALERETAKQTTFITPMGRFFFKRLLFGVSSASEIFQREMS